MKVLEIMIKLYKIYSKDDPQKCYYGITTQNLQHYYGRICHRFQQFQNNEKPSAIAANLLAEYGTKGCSIMTIQEFTKNEKYKAIEARESLIRSSTACQNTYYKKAKETRVCGK